MRTADGQGMIASDQVTRLDWTQRGDSDEEGTGDTGDGGGKAGGTRRQAKKGASCT
ncbi:hypothetical protein E2C01_080013 [Portunus trituberculatus]|uniref:Uncharacterized protein n=1 Tax=Portunus trituberculatus TaxID=210409 RepID=A0A5B7IX52_PORTR|nr:hypothetical protein [Portunus trituberculatus]